MEYAESVPLSSPPSLSIQHTNIRRPFCGFYDAAVSICMTIDRLQARGNGSGAVSLFPQRMLDGLTHLAWSHARACVFLCLHKSSLDLYLYFITDKPRWYFRGYNMHVVSLSQSKRTGLRKPSYLLAIILVTKRNGKKHFTHSFTLRLVHFYRFQIVAR